MDLAEPPRPGVIHVVPSLGSGGAERLLAAVVGATGHFLHVVVPLQHDDFFREDLVSSGALVISRSGGGPLAMIRMIRSALKSYPEAVVQGWTFNADLLTAVAILGLNRRRHVWSIHAGPLPRRDFGLRIRVVRLALALLSWISPSRIVSCSPEAFQTAVKVGYRRSRMQIIPNGVDTERFCPLESDQPRREPTAIFPARWQTPKDHETLLRAWELVAQDIPGAKLLLVGKGCTEENYDARSLLDSLGICKSVELLGEQGDLVPILQRADLVVISSVSEALPLALCEGMAVGLVPVVTNVGSMPAVAGDSGVVVEPRDVHGLAKALIEMLRLEPGELEQRGSQARERIVSAYSLEACAARYTELWSEVARDIR